MKSWLRSQPSERWIILSFMLLIMTVIFGGAVSHLGVDRTSEGAEYLKVPYQMVARHRLRIQYGDPFAENGPQAVFLSAAIAYYFGLLPMRVYHYLFSLAAVAVFFFFFLKETETYRKLSAREVIAYATAMLGAYLSIPIILIYPIQTNGMTPGLLCFLTGLWLLRKHPNWAMFAFGWAYAFKGQFMAFLPGLLLYRAVYDVREKTFLRHAGQVLWGAALFFVPTTVIIATIAGIFGMFDNWEEYRIYATWSFSILHHELLHIYAKFVGIPLPDAAGFQEMRRTIRNGEFAHWGHLVWIHVYFSAIFCLVSATWGTWAQIQRLRGKKALQPPPSLVLLGVAGSLYWVNYLAFWSYPYFYNTLPIMWFNVIGVPIAFFAAGEILSKKFKGSQAQLARRAVLAACLVVGLGLFVHTWRKTPGWFNAKNAQGDSLEPYPFMSESEAH